MSDLAPVALRFDRAVLAFRELEAASERLASLGFEVRPGGRHVGFGTENAIVRFGLDYLELMTVRDEAEAAAASARSRALVEFLRRYPSGFAGYALASDDLDEIRARLAGVGQACEGPTPMRRLRPDGAELAWELLIPGGVAWRRPWPFFIQWALPDSRRLAIEQPGSHRNGTRAVAGISVAVEDLARARVLYEAMLGPAAETVQRLVFRVEGFEIVVTGVRDARVDPERGPGPFELRLRVDDIERTRQALGAAGRSTATGIQLEALPSVLLSFHA